MLGYSTGMVAQLDRALHRDLEGPCAALVSYYLGGVRNLYGAFKAGTATSVDPDGEDKHLVLRAFSGGKGKKTFA